MTFPLVQPLSKLFLTGNYETCGEWWKFFQSLPNIMLSISGGLYVANGTTTSPLITILFASSLTG